MKKITPEQPPKLARPKLYAFTLLYALLITTCVVAQLFAIDKMMEHELFASPGSILFLTLMVFMAVFSLPYVLRLATSQLMRMCSLVCASLLPIMWLAFAIYTQPASREIGLLGVYFAHPIITLLLVCAAAVLGLLTFLALGAPRLKK